MSGLQLKKRVVLIGSGGHAKVVIEILREGQAYEIVGCLARASQQSNVLGVPILGGDELLPDLLSEGVRTAFVAIGSNSRRREVTSSLRQLGFSLVNAISPRAMLSASVRIGEGVAIMPGAVVNADTNLGHGVIINTGATVDHDCQVGDFAHVAPGSHLAGGVRLGEGCLIGIGSSVISEITVGSWSILGAGSVVVRSLPAEVTAYGVPAMVRG